MSVYDDPWHFTPAQEAEAEASMIIMRTAIELDVMVAYKCQLHGEEVIVLGVPRPQPDGRMAVSPMAVVSAHVLAKLIGEGGPPVEENPSTS